MNTISYEYVRALELEGRQPSDVGCWPLTVQRMEIGEGVPRPSSEFALVTFAYGEPIPPSRRPPPDVMFHNFYYRRIRSSEECDRHRMLEPGTVVRPAFHLTAAWADPPGGMIPRPSPTDLVIPHTHSVSLKDRLPDRRLFKFRVKWKDWGEGGFGYMPYDYFDRFVFDCWATYGNGVLRLYKFRKLDEDGHVQWSAHDEEDHHIFAFEVRDALSINRLAWTFIIERDGALEVEELYVRPEYRGHGHGRWLADRVAQLARTKRVQLRLWVAFADCKSESEANYSALVAIARRLGTQFQSCPVPWAAYFGTTEVAGEVFPVEPAVIPDRPRVPWKEVIAAAALAIGQGEASMNVAPPTIATQAVGAEITVGTPEWVKLTERRASLIDKMYSPGQVLTSEEQSEYELLQQQSRATVQRAYPRPRLSPDDLAIVKKVLGINEDREGP